MNSADLAFVNHEAAKLTNLVEAQAVERPIPIVSFVARQRDLRELIGEHVPGAERLSFGDSLDYQQGRFDTITLEDRNLPAIAEKRVLQCKDGAARMELDAAFEQVARMKDSVMNILLTHEGDRKMFRQVYPFSPALVQTLIAVSSVLQRERTALKVMMQLLVDHRETLKLGDVVPVGDLFDVVAHGDEAFSQDMAIHFDNAKRLYHQKLLPVLEKKHGRREEIETLAYDDPRRAAFRNDDRLVKTLLLSALVPEVESLRGLNAEKLAALNHGTIRTPIPGREAQEVLSAVPGLGGQRGRDPHRRGGQPHDHRAALRRGHREHHRAGPPRGQPGQPHPPRAADALRAAWHRGRRRVRAVPRVLVAEHQAKLHRAVPQHPRAARLVAGERRRRAGSW